MSSPTPDEPSTSLESLEEEVQKLLRQLAEVEKQRIEYLQNVSHQIVAPLNAMKWHIENITENRLSVDRARKVLRSIYSQATLAVHLAKNFSLMSNLEGDHTLSSMREPAQEVNLRRLMINLADDFQPLGWEQELRIIVDDKYFPEGPPVLAIKPLISQVFSNIFENAVKYSTTGSNVIATGAYNAGANTFNVHIRNLGIGLKATDYEKVFERTYRSDEAKRRYPAGTGFGLYIAKRILAIHKGTISAATLDGWTVFSVELPIDPRKREKQS